MKGFRCDVEASVTFDKANFPIISSFSASLAGLLWKQVLSQKSILVDNVDFAKDDTIPMFIRVIIW